MSEVRLIDANALKKSLNFVYACSYIESKSKEGIASDIIEKIDNAPTVKAFTVDEVEEIRQATMEQVRISCKQNERPQGEWIDYNAHYYTCPFCKRTVGIDFLIQSYENPIKTYNFCPNCGADMRGKEE